MRPSRHPLIPGWQIAQRARALARQIQQEYGPDLPTFVVLVEGGRRFADEITQYFPAAEIFPIKCTSYDGTDRKELTIDMMGLPASRVWARFVVVIDDIIDSGVTMRAVKDKLQDMGASDVARCVLVRREGSLCEAEYVGFLTGPGFLVGYGMDYKGRFRDLPAVHTLVSDWDMNDVPGRPRGLREV